MYCMYMKRLSELSKYKASAQAFFVFSRHYRDHEGFARSKEHIHLKLIGHQVVNYIHAVQQEMPNPNRSSTGIHQTKPIIFNLI
ncbi:hypothetical protein B31L_0852 [Bifidobacterium breve 31L]|nr:hypothetical protein B31L_0852 [Bifidobacterium breve 31L]